MVGYSGFIGIRANSCSIFWDIPAPSQQAHGCSKDADLNAAWLREVSSSSRNVDYMLLALICRIGGAHQWHMSRSWPPAKMTGIGPESG